VRSCQQPVASVAAMALALGLNASLLRKSLTMAAGRRGSAETKAPVMLSVRTELAAVSVPAPMDG